ncbi:MAG: hypothetical protein HZB55_05330 [Deltaproteobacteria bacterium]|nr:hypothetical protein [Deltaproteobacteria bacterium]
MIREMRELAVLELNRLFGTTADDLGALRRTHGERLAEYLVEAGEKISKVYLLQATGPGTVRMWAEELDDEKRRRLPFVKRPGSQSAAVGPVLKRTHKKETPPYGPSPKTQKTTQKDFEALAQSARPWAGFFKECCDVAFNAEHLVFKGDTLDIDRSRETVLSRAIAVIPERETVYLAIVDPSGLWPGQRPEYHAYFAETLAEIKYNG